MPQDDNLLCSIYRSSRERELYLYIPKTKSLSDIPAELIKRMGKAELAMTLLISPDRKLARVDAKIVLQNISEKGYFLQLPPSFNPQVVKYGK